MNPPSSLKAIGLPSKPSHSFRSVVAVRSVQWLLSRSASIVHRNMVMIAGSKISEMIALSRLSVDYHSFIASPKEARKEDVPPHTCIGDRTSPAML